MWKMVRDYVLFIAKTMVNFHHKGTTNEWSFGQQHVLQKGLKIFKDTGHDAVRKELDQITQAYVFYTSKCECE